MEHGDTSQLPGTGHHTALAGEAQSYLVGEADSHTMVQRRLRERSKVVSNVTSQVTGPDWDLEPGMVLWVEWCHQKDMLKS